MSEELEVHPRFGALVRVGRSSKFVGTLLAVVGTLLVAAMASLPVLDRLHNGRDGGLVLWVLLTSPFWVLGLVLVRSGLKYRTQILAVYEGGFVRVDWRSRVEAAWSEIEGIRRTSYTKDGAVLRDNCWVEIRGRKPLVVVDLALSDSGQVGAALDLRSAAALAPRCEQALRSGQSVPFGPITMTASGLTVKGTSFAWDEVAALAFSRPARQLLSTRGRYESAPTLSLDLRPRSGKARTLSLAESAILNPEVLADLASRIGGVAVVR